MCRTSAEGPGTSSAAGCWLSSGGTRPAPVKDTRGDGQLGFHWFLFGQNMLRSVSVCTHTHTHLQSPILNVLPLADWFCHHLPVRTSWLHESSKGRLSHSWYARGSETGDHTVSLGQKKVLLWNSVRVTSLLIVYQCCPRWKPSSLELLPSQLNSTGTSNRKHCACLTCSPCSRCLCWSSAWRRCLQLGGGCRASSSVVEAHCTHTSGPVSRVT